jgi:hypothetical protein
MKVWLAKINAKIAGVHPGAGLAGRLPKIVHFIAFIP